MTEKWTKKCECGCFIPDDYEICDSCLLTKYDLIYERYYGEDDGLIAYYEDAVLKAIRKAERK